MFDDLPEAFLFDRFVASSGIENVPHLGKQSPGMFESGRRCSSGVATLNRHDVNGYKWEENKFSGPELINCR